ncbi:aldehyde dehydrogenase family protein [Massilia cavernae]|uniref:Aldehyde dehydrogenase n=1 Tax=Massilia cavernae TaxID=2320864 RepID=A0A418X721_9BURK|nr:aldehyde dehydrogenase family protein [Massilia cavernae]RJG08262.1 aldehyde dehydrogenase family protein [Massilia cavernae]
MYVSNSLESNCAGLAAEKLALLRSAAQREPYSSLAVRRDRLGRAIDALIKNEKRIVQAMDADFGGRPEALTLLADVMAPLTALRHAHKNVARWMRPEKRKALFPMGLIGGRARVHHQPLGVIGIVSPWNVPVGIGFSGLAGALAAGNRAMIKPSELAPKTADLIAEMLGSAFGADEVAVLVGGVDVARAFTELPFDHLLFTGGPGTARVVMAAAARNLVPVTLELGGKSPAIVARGSDLAYAAGKIVCGKLGNAGQVCMGVDYVLVHRSDAAGFTQAVRAAIDKHYPNLANNPDYANVHLPRQRDRLARLVEEAKAGGARVEVIGGMPVSALRNANRFPPVLVFNPPAGSALLTEEVFGPVLPIVSYDSIEHAAALINVQTRPLALYYIGGSAADKDYLLKHTHSGGVTFGDVMLHPMMQDLPFGGVGESGMGRYLGYDGFKAFSNQRGVFERPWIDISRYFAPPYTPGLLKMMRRAIR